MDDSGGDGETPRLFEGEERESLGSSMTVMLEQISSG